MNGEPGRVFSKHEIDRIYGLTDHAHTLERVIRDWPSLSYEHRTMWDDFQVGVGRRRGWVDKFGGALISGIVGGLLGYVFAQF